MKIIAIFFCLSLVACGKVDRQVAYITGSSESCIDGVKYIQFPSGVSVKYTREGRIATC